MMKKKKTWIIVIISVVILLLAALIIYFATGSNKLYLKSYEVSDVKQVNDEIPSFTIVVNGLYNGVITKETLAKDSVPVYSFNASTDTGRTVYTDNYTGVRVMDVFDKAGYTDYSELVIKAPGDLQVTYKKEEISDKAFLAFYRNGEYFRDSNEPVNYLAIDFDYRYSVENAIIFTFR